MAPGGPGIRGFSVSRRMGEGKMGLQSNLADWQKITNAADIVFSKQLVKLRTDNPVAFSSLSPVLTPVRKGTDPTTHSLARLLELAGGSDTIDGNNCPPETLKVMTAEFQKLRDEAKTYIALVDKAIPAKVAVGPHETKSLKDVYPEAYRHLKILKTGIEAIFATTATALKSVSVRKDAAKISEKAKMPIEEAKTAMDDAKVKELKNIENQRKDLLTLAVRYRAVIAKGAAAIQKIKASPTVQNYNDEMDKAGRDISQIIVNIKKMKATDKIKDLPEVKKLPDPGDLAQAIAEFGNDNGQYRKLDEEKLKKKSFDETVKLFSSVVKQIAVLYQPLMDMK
jgi:hypothetical protein